VLPPQRQTLRILDAGCGTGVSTDYLAHLNPGAEILAVDISAGTLAMAQERCQRSGAIEQATVRFQQRSLLDLAGEGPFDHINSVGVLHHLDNPQAGLKALAPLLAPGGILHLFLYADAGRWEIHRVQRALGLLGAGYGEEGLRLGRALLRELPEENRLRQRHESRWAIDTAHDPNFADMYLHPQETSYDLGFSNPEQWQLERLLRGELLERAQALPQEQQWLLMEALDPEISHWEFFLSNQPLARQEWTDDQQLLAAIGTRSVCLWGWPSPNLLDRNMAPLQLSDEQWALMQTVNPDQNLGSLDLALTPAQRCKAAREMHAAGVLLLSE
jgi:SAM-dependent methyltransferase